MIKKILLKDILESTNAEELFEEYYRDGSVGLTQGYCVNKELFYLLDSLGIIDCVGVYHNNILVGFIIASTSESPHYNMLITTVTSIFILKEHRKSGSAKKMLALIEDIAKARGSKLVIVSAPKGSALHKYAPMIGYKESHMLCSKVLV